MLNNNELKHNPFVIPENYFDSLPSKIQNKCVSNRKKDSAFGLIPRIIFSGGGIATVALTLFLSLLYTSDQKLKNGNPSENVAIADGADGYSTEDIREKNRKNAMVRYLAVRNVNSNDILLARSK